jgi:hypothetical protein
MRHTPTLAPLKLQQLQASIMAPATLLLSLDDTKAPNYRNNNWLKDLGNYFEWPKVAGAVIKTQLHTCG